MPTSSEKIDLLVYGRHEVDQEPLFARLDRPTKKLIYELVDRFRPTVMRVRQLEVQLGKLKYMLAQAGNEKDVVDIYGKQEEEEGDEF